jgi:flagellar assembly protein FliH
VGDTEQHLVSLAIEIAQKIVGEVPISPEMIEASVREALSQVEGTAEFHVRLHPADLELLQKIDSALLQPLGEERPARFHGSPEVTRGGCLVQTRFGIVDARRETKLELLKRSLLG